ncbi:MAG: hypothetical protein AAGF35_13255 [Pseudomonadota bacterium]
MGARRKKGSFLAGLGWGMILGFAMMLTPVLWLGLDGTGQWYSALSAQLLQLWALARENLRGSTLPFALVFAVYCYQLYQLHQRFQVAKPDMQRVVHHEQLLDLCANLFFGIGVIWTAIGMRDALLFALGDPSSAAAQGAFTVLQRMVDGGILLALSTTIVGGVGGYLMRIVKSVSLGRAMNNLYMDAAEQPGKDNLAILRRIESLLARNTTKDRSSSL